METHLKVLGILHIVFGALGLLVALIIVAVFGGLAGVIGATADAGDAALVVPILGLVGSVVVLLLLVLSVPGIILGVGLLRRRPWSRLFGIVLSAISLINVPFGTLLGAYGLWVLLTPETQPLFVPGGPPELSP
jgi:hypothetical protein